MPRPEHIRAALFDMDGTSLDSEPLKRRSLHDTFLQYGSDISEERLSVTAGTNGPDFFDCVRRLLAEERIQMDVFDFLATSPWGAQGDVYDHPDLRPMPGFVELAQALRTDGIKLGLVSTSPSPQVSKALARTRMTPLFDVIVCGDMVSHHKPDPEPYLYAMELLGVGAGECVIFEDSTSGLASGLASGAYVIGLGGSKVSHDISAAHEVIATFEGFRL